MPHLEVLGLRTSTHKLGNTIQPTPESLWSKQEQARCAPEPGQGVCTRARRREWQDGGGTGRYPPQDLLRVYAKGSGEHCGSELRLPFLKILLAAMWTVTGRGQVQMGESFEPERGGGGPARV